MIDVSVIIPTFNSPSSCCEAISSCFASKGVNIEVIVIDDGGEALTRNLIIETFGDLEPQENHYYLQLNNRQTIRYFFQQNQGAYRTRLKATQYANGEFLKFLDHDDVLIENALGKEIELARQENTDVVMTNWIIRHYDEKSAESEDEQKHAPDYSQMNCIDGILQKGCPYTSANLYRSSIFKGMIPVDGWSPRLNDDWVIALQVCLAEPKYSTLPINSYIWQHHPEQQSRNTPKGHVDEFYSVLTWFEAQLDSSERLYDDRKKVIADYYFKNAILLSQYQPDRWKKIAQRIAGLNPNFKPRSNLFINFWFKVIGLEKAITFYVTMKNYVLPRKS